MAIEEIVKQLFTDDFETVEQGLEAFQNTYTTYDEVIECFNALAGQENEWFNQETLEWFFGDIERSDFRYYIVIWFLGYFASFPENKEKVEEYTSLQMHRLGWHKLPPTMRYFTGLQNLGLARHGLRELPDWIGELTELRELHLWENELTSLPESIGNLKKLEKLDLSSNELEALPESIGNLESLREISIGANVVTSLPEPIGNWSNLTRLSLGTNNLERLPKSLQNLGSLKTLDLIKNGLSEWSEQDLNDAFETIGKLPVLKELYIGDNGLQTIPEGVCNLTELKTLSVRWNPLKNLPESMVKMVSLETVSFEEAPLNLSEEEAQPFFQRLAALPCLKTLNLNETGLSILPQSFGLLKTLEFLYIENNKIVSFSENASGLEGLKLISLNTNHFGEMTEEEVEQLFSTISLIPNLETLWAGITRWPNKGTLKKLPDSIGDCKNLKKLKIENQDITTLPESIGNLSQLEYLELEANRLTSLPQSLSKLARLKGLKLGKNKLSVHAEEEIQQLIQALSFEDDEVDPEDFNASFFKALPRFVRLYGNDFSKEAEERLKEALPKIDIEI